VIADGGPGVDTFKGGPGRELFVPDYEYPTPPPVTFITPVAYWNLNETSGRKIADSAGTPQDGTFFGCSPDLDDPGPMVLFGAETSVHFHNNSSEYVAVAHDGALEVEKGTVQFWFKTDQTCGTQTIFSKDHYGYKDGGHLIISLVNSTIEVRMQSKTESYIVRTGNLVKASNWHHLAFTFGEGGMKLYLDGVLVGSNNYSGGLIGNKEPIVIGGSNWANQNDSGDLSKLGISQPFNGYIDEVAFYDKVLGGDQVKRLMQDSPLAVQTSPLVSMDTESYVYSSMEPERKDWLKDFLVEVAARAYNPFEPKDKINIKIFDDEEE
jgi:hypothetical protein